jgi:adenosine deaminase
MLGDTSVAEQADEDEKSADVYTRGELHVHMNGAVPTSTIREILAEEATVLPAGFQFERDLVRTTPCQSLTEYLKPWQVLRLFPKKRENLDRLTLAVLADLAENNVRFVELRSSVLYLAALQNCSPAQALEHLIESTGRAAECHDIRRGLIITVTRGDYGAVNLSTLLQAYQDLGEPKDIIGLDLAGDEEIAYPAELPSLFREAKDKFGLGITIHAGETGRVENVRDAVELFGADRIGHGTAAGKDPKLLELLAAKRVCVEVCPIKAVRRIRAGCIKAVRRIRVGCISAASCTIPGDLAVAMLPWRMTPSAYAPYGSGFVCLLWRKPPSLHRPHPLTANGAPRQHPMALIMR